MTDPCKSVWSRLWILFAAIVVPTGCGVLQGFLEGSNVDPVKELVNLIRTQRAFEMNSQSIQAADEALQTIGQLRRF